MTEISFENEKFVEDLISSGQFVSRVAVLDQAVRLLREQLQDDGEEAASNLTAQQWCDRFDQWAESHRALSSEADDSRESIYAGRGE